MTDAKSSPPVILIVDDDELLRLLTVDIVERAGFAALEAGDADEAAAILESRPDVALLLADINMPGSTNGLTLAHAVRCRWPSIKIVIVSGEGRPSDDDLPPDSRFVAKPYWADEMISELRSLVGR